MFSVILFVFGMFVSSAFGNECPAGYTMEGCEERGLIRDVIGCCEKPKKSGWGKKVSTIGCKSGLVVEGGHCCWPDQGWANGKCLGKPKCPSGLVAYGNECVVPPCPSGKVRVSGHCCWPGQAWSSSGKKCVGSIVCPSGYAVRSNGQGCYNIAEQQKRDEEKKRQNAERKKKRQEAEASRKRKEAEAEAAQRKRKNKQTGYSQYYQIKLIPRHGVLYTIRTTLKRQI